jgi:hypothetical protein
VTAQARPRVRIESHALPWHEADAAPAPNASPPARVAAGAGRSLQADRREHG